MWIVVYPYIHYFSLSFVIMYKCIPGISLFMCTCMYSNNFLVKLKEKPTHKMLSQISDYLAPDWVQWVISYLSLNILRTLNLQLNLISISVMICLHSGWKLTQVLLTLNELMFYIYLIAAILLNKLL